jgi:hypothetical protein
MGYEQWGPLGGLVGEWEGNEGLDVSFHNEHGKVKETEYREKTSFKPFGPVDNGPQLLYGLDYRTAAWRGDEENPFHTECGYWLWDERDLQVMRCFMVPRGSTIIAGGSAAPNATSFLLEADLGSTTYGILSNKYLDQFARTTRYDASITIEGTTFHYDETTTVEHSRSSDLILHTDRNTLTRVSTGS